MRDPALEHACEIVTAARGGGGPLVQTFFDEATSSATYLVRDPGSRACAVIDSVLGFDPSSGRTCNGPTEALCAAIRAEGLEVAWILETHVHADHLSAAARLKEAFGGRTAIGAAVTKVADLFAGLIGPTRAEAAFDRLLRDGDRLSIGGLDGVVLAVPGHTPADVAFVIGDAVFVGDTLFMPDFGTARADFPGADAALLYASIQRLLSLPPETRLFTCHDYKAPGRDAYAWETTVAAERAGNVHVREGVTEAEFVALRRARDATLPVPKLIWPALQVNLRGGRLPEPEPDGGRYLKIPVNAI